MSVVQILINIITLSVSYPTYQLNVSTSEAKKGSVK